MFRPSSCSSIRVNRALRDYPAVCALTLGAGVPKAAVSIAHGSRGRWLPSSSLCSTGLQPQGLGIVPCLCQGGETTVEEASYLHSPLILPANPFYRLEDEGTDSSNKAQN